MSQLAMGIGSYTEWLCNRTLDFWFGADGRLALKNDVYYFGLSQKFAQVMTGSYVEPVAASYRRAVVANDGLMWPAAIYGCKRNSLAITFPIPTEPWGLIKSVFMSDAPTGGNVYIVGNLVTAMSIDADYIESGNGAPQFAAGAFYLQDS